MTFLAVRPLHFILLMGLVSLFADMTYEGARSIIGQYLALLGASGAVVGAVAGGAELLGYGVRLPAGYLSDRSGRHWLFALVGYALNLLAVPLLALTTHWPTAAALVLLEHFGKALRSPAKDTLLSYATHSVGRGFGFGLHEALDQIGAVVGPLFVSAILWRKGSYPLCFAMLAVPALASLATLAVARLWNPHPEDWEEAKTSHSDGQWSTKLWLYFGGIGCLAAGFVDFPLVAYHLSKSGHHTAEVIPLFFAAAMAIDGIAAVALGKLYDAKGIAVMAAVAAGAAAAAPLLFLGGDYAIAAGIALWGIALGAQESIMRAIVADLVGKDRRATAYGLFNVWFGLFWFGGSALMGLLYDVHPLYLALFSTAAQLAAIPFFLAIRKKDRR